MINTFCCTKNFPAFNLLSLIRIIKIKYRIIINTQNILKYSEKILYLSNLCVNGNFMTTENVFQLN